MGRRGRPVVVGLVVVVVVGLVVVVELVVVVVEVVVGQATSTAPGAMPAAGETDQLAPPGQVR